MISQNCPKCNSGRVRKGYRPTPFWSKILFRYNLLCDNCNWEFAGFAVPGTVTVKPNKTVKKKKKTLNNKVEKDNLNNLDSQTSNEAENENEHLKESVSEKSKIAL